MLWKIIQKSPKMVLLTIGLVLLTIGLVLLTIGLVLLTMHWSVVNGYGVCSNLMFGYVTCQTIHFQNSENCLILPKRTCVRVLTLFVLMTKKGT